MFGFGKDRRDLRILRHLLHELTEEVEVMAGEIDALTAEVARNTALTAQLITLAQTPPATDLSGVVAATTQLKTTDDAIASALPPTP